jgi:hypothetical protein
VLGEGPAWIEEDAVLWFADINSAQLHRYEPETGAGAPLGGIGDTDRLREHDVLGTTIGTIPMPAHNSANDLTIARDGLSGTLPLRGVRLDQ